MKERKRKTKITPSQKTQFLIRLKHTSMKLRDVLVIGQSLDLNYKQSVRLLKQLVAKNLIIKTPDLADLRRFVYMKPLHVPRPLVIQE